MNKLSKTLLIGYGNECRGDDALGPHVARLLEARRLPGLQAVAVQQLTPELAEELSRVEQAIFVDARLGGEGPAVQIEAIAPQRCTSPMTHALAPPAILALAEVLYGRAPQAWLVTIAGERFKPGAPLTMIAQRGAEEAMKQIEHRWQADEIPPGPRRAYASTLA